MDVVGRLIVSYLPEPEQHPCWLGIKAILEPACEPGAPVLEPGELVWIIHEQGTIYAAFTTRLTTDGSADLMNVGGTRLKDWFGQAEGVLCQWARDCGAWRLTARGRKGWRRMVERRGWAPHGIDGYVKDLRA